MDLSHCVNWRPQTDAMGQSRRLNGVHSSSSALPRIATVMTDVAALTLKSPGPINRRMKRLATTVRSLAR
jgi:hypothetical protein